MSGCPLSGHLLAPRHRIPLFSERALHRELAPPATRPPGVVEGEKKPPKALNQVRAGSGRTLHLNFPPPWLAPERPCHAGCGCLVSPNPATSRHQEGALRLRAGGRAPACQCRPRRAAFPGRPPLKVPHGRGHRHRRRHHHQHRHCSGPGSWSSLTTYSCPTARASRRDDAMGPA